MEPRPRSRRTSEPPIFVTGSLLRHILIMTGTGAVGLMAIFVGDLANIFFLSQLGDESIVAAVGYASSIQFLTISIGIGLAIAASSLVAPALGAGQRMRARRLSMSCHAITFAASAVLSAAVWLATPSLMTLFGATGKAHDLGTTYLRILTPSLPLLALAMTSSAVLRSVGDAQRSMQVTLYGAIANIILDAILILWLGLGIEGAAIASTLARVAILAVAYNGVVRVHDLVGRPRLANLKNDAPLVAAIAIPAVLSNVATPIGNAYVTAAIAPFGDAAVAGWAVIGRLIPVAFGAIYALSGIVGPVLGQNYGALRFDRMRETLTQSLLVTAAFTAIAWVALALLAGPIVLAFKATGDTADLILLFCRWLSPLFVFLGGLFVANAAFNTLGKAHYSTALNWGRATIGTVPFVMAGAAYAGASGVVAAHMVGGIVFGCLAVRIAYRLVDQLAANNGTPPLVDEPEDLPPPPPVR